MCVLMENIFSKRMGLVFRMYNRFLILTTLLFFGIPFMILGTMPETIIGDIASFGQYIPLLLFGFTASQFGILVYLIRYLESSDGFMILFYTGLMTLLVGILAIFVSVGVLNLTITLPVLS